MKGIDALRSEHIEKALSFLDEALKIYPAHSQSHNARAVALHQIQRNDEAEKAFRMALRFDGESLEPRFNLGKLLLRNYSSTVC